MGASQLATLKHPKKNIVEFVNFLENRNKQTVDSEIKNEKITWNLQNQWKDHILQFLKKIRPKSKLKNLANIFILATQNIKSQCFIKAVTVLSAIDNYQVEQLNSKPIVFDSHRSIIILSNNVFVEITKREELIQQTESSSFNNKINGKSVIKEKQQKHKIEQILIIEFNEDYHPFYYYQQQFLECFILKHKHNIEKFKKQERSKDQIYKQMRRQFNFFIDFLIESAIIYKKWIINKINLNQHQYHHFIKKIVINSIFSHQNQLYPLLLYIIQQLNKPFFQSLLPKIPDNININKFKLEPTLQIEGNFILSMQLLSEIQKIDNPYKLMQFLENLKNQICNDIDLFHKFFETNLNFMIDGDNLLTILCFQVCKLKPKFQKIYSQTILLPIIFEDSAVTSFGASSYMLTVFQAVFEYISGPQFIIQTA